MLLFVSYALDIYLYYVQGVGRSGFCGGGLSVAGWASGAGPEISRSIEEFVMVHEHYDS